MKITKRQLKQIIKEELSKTLALNEADFRALNDAIKTALDKLDAANTEEERQKAQEELKTAREEMKKAERDFVERDAYRGGYYHYLMEEDKKKMSVEQIEKFLEEIRSGKAEKRLMDPLLGAAGYEGRAYGLGQAAGDALKLMKADYKAQFTDDDREVMRVFARDMMDEYTRRQNY